MSLVIASVFPGQGSQHIGMLKELATTYSQVPLMFEAVSDRLGYDLWKLIQEGPAASLNLTEHTQAAMLTADVAIYRLMEQQIGLRSAMMAGHSLGEYAALVCAGAIDLPSAAELVTRRGQLMQETVPVGTGAMAAIVGLTNDQVQTICVQASSELEQVTPANYNAIGQVVVAGHTPAVERVIGLADELGAQLARVIPVSVPCHCALLTKAAERYEECLRAAPFVTPKLPVISNVDLSIYESPEQIRHLLKEQLYSPVRWVETIQKMKQSGVQYVIESGPGRVLGGLIKRIDKELKVVSVNDLSGLDQLKGDILL